MGQPDTVRQLLARPCNRPEDAELFDTRVTCPFGNPPVAARSGQLRPATASRSSCPHGSINR